MSVKEFVYLIQNHVDLHKLFKSPNIIHLCQIVEEYECSHQDVSQAIYIVHEVVRVVECGPCSQFFPTTASNLGLDNSYIMLNHIQ